MSHYMLRRIHPAMFAVTLLCFLLPFAVVSCEDPNGESSLTDGLDQESSQQTQAREEPAMSFRGFELVVGKAYPESGGFATVFEAFASRPTGLRWPAESFAITAILAAFSGLVLTTFVSTPRRAFLGALAASAGVLSMLLLNLSPSLRGVGLLRVEWKIGYWSTMSAFIASLALSAWHCARNACQIKELKRLRRRGILSTCSRMLKRRGARRLSTDSRLGPKGMT